MPDSYFPRQAPKSARDYDDEAKIDPKAPSVLQTLNYRWEREIFLDAWWDRYPDSFNTFHKAFKGRGKDMINGLEERNPMLFTEVFHFAEIEARKLVR